MAVMLSSEQFEILIGRLTTAGGIGGGGGRKRRLDPKYLKTENFNGNQSGWADWVFALKRTVRAMDKECFELMEKVEKVTGDFNENDLNDFTENRDVSGLSGELYDFLCTIVTGDAVLILKSVDEYRGCVAWSKLHAKFNPKTTARAIKLLSEVCSPGPVIHEVEAAISKWKNKVKTLEREFGETLGDKMKFAIITALLPANVQDYVFQTVTNAMDFDTMLGKIGVWISNRVAMEGTPMDIGEVKHDGWFDEW
jgi:hypothetical protein